MAATVIDRGPWNALVDDDGTDTIGTPWTKNQIKIVELDPIDAALAAVEATRVNGAAALDASALTLGTVPLARLSLGTRTERFVTATGTVNDWAPGLSGNTVLFVNASSPLTITGLAAGVQGQEVILVSVGAAPITLKDMSQASAASNRLITFVQSDMLLAPHARVHGYARFVYDGAYGSRWVLVGFFQGDPLPLSPFLSFGGVSAGIGYTVANGIYTLTGNICSFSGRLTLNVKGTATGAAAINGLPFQCSGANGAWGRMVGPYYAGFTGSMTLGVMGYIAAADNKIQLMTPGTGNVVGVSDVHFSPNTDLIFTGDYPVT